ncbi:tannase/feruloyl esterase family alpha/beta hydrolase [Novosphingobium sp. PS1R-30]|uniref:Tannase/feruloyl esterase family alpha/beta hydrolase n=1 Tax=Novosphingobium anseongense TaxID=3133436 RepID=A0ABU8S1D1_9SPHN
MIGDLRSVTITGGLTALICLTAPQAAWAQQGQPTTGAAQAARSCEGLQGLTIEASRMALPTGGARITGARTVAASEPGKVGYCSVDGEIRPIDPKGFPIKFNVALPDDWNGKAMHLMGGGWDGFVVSGSSAVVGAEHLPTPLARGYAAFGSDSGHEYRTPDWQANDEAFENFAGNQLRKTHDAAMAIIERRYAARPRLTYATGGSGGGREALYAADRWPELYDGVIAFYPVWSAVGAFSGWIDNAQALASPGAWSNPAQQAAISRAVIDRCDGLDGLVDGLVGDTGACHVDPASLRCPEGKPPSDDCLAPAQVAGLVRAYGTERKLPFRLPNGVDRFHAYNVLNGGAQPRMGKVSPGGPITSDTNFGGANETAFGAVLSDPFVRFAVARDPSADLFSFRADGSAAIKRRMIYLARRMDVDPTMARFVAKGGKILLVHGNSDQVHSADWSDEFHDRMFKAYGPGKGRAHLRYYRVPGFGHGIGLRHGAKFDFQADMLSALEGWVERGTAPADLTATDDTPERNRRTRPLCEYPTYARYQGGAPDLAASFRCVAPETGREGSRP